ncbi:transposase [Cupriavidus sp. D384]|uniref:IS91 family transposase n=1 Tax=Cupriavidus sp. D384 TaxID=1538095 RepID=UPI000AD136B9|nr:transposase [Cupriavidus sp. D384]
MSVATPTISPLRQRMIEDMRMRKLADKTPGLNPIESLSTRQLNRAVHAATQAAEIDKRVSMHTLRHSFATHLLGFFLSVRVLSRLFRRRFLDALQDAHTLGQLQFFGEYSALANPDAFAQWLAPLRATECVVYAKRPFAGPKAVLAYLSRYTHRVAISNQRLVSLDERGVTFRWKDYRAKGRTRRKTMTLDVGEFMRRFLLHVLPGSFHRIRHYGLLANPPARRANLVKIRSLLSVVPAVTAAPDDTDVAAPPSFVCRHCGAPMLVIEVIPRSACIRGPPPQRALA